MNAYRCGHSERAQAQRGKLIPEETTEDGVSHFVSVQSFIDGMTVGSRERSRLRPLPPRDERVDLRHYGCTFADRGADDQGLEQLRA